MSYAPPSEEYYDYPFTRKLGITPEYVVGLPEDYLDGCTFGFLTFGSIKHEDICAMHDAEWAAIRQNFGVWSPWYKTKSDWLYGWRIMQRHTRLSPWALVAYLYGPLAFLGLATGGLFWWFQGGPNRDEQAS